MAYCYLIPGTCTVKCAATPEIGGAVLVPSAPSIAGMNVEQFNAFWPGYISVPPHCRTGGGSGGGTGPITPGPDDPPETPPSCGPTVPVPILPPGDDYDVPPSIAGGGGGGTGHPGQRGTLAHWNEPVVGKKFWAPTVDAMTDQHGKWNRPPAHRFDDKGALAVPRWATGDGLMVIMSPELAMEDVYGNKGASGANQERQYPPVISETGILFFNAEGEVGDAISIAAWGKRVPGTNKPGSGLYAKLDPSTGHFKLQHTDPTGVDQDADKYVSMNQIQLRPVAAADVPTPDSGLILFCDSADGLPKTRDAAGDLHTIAYV